MTKSQKANKDEVIYFTAIIPPLADKKPKLSQKRF